MNHYCTYFDSGFLLQGVALWRSLQVRDVEAVLWVLALDERAAEVLRALGDPGVRVVSLAEIEAGDPELAAVKTTRSRVEYYFTLSPCLPRWLLRAHPDIACITYLDADLYFFGRPQVIAEALEASGASVLITAHRFPVWLTALECFGRYNVGLQSYRNNHAGLAVLDDWRARCLAWCHDHVDGDRYADQKYLDAWPERFGEAVLVLQHPGVNFAPWNWPTHRAEVDDDGSVRIDGTDLIVFHFARFRPILGTWWWLSGQVHYGVMPWSLRQAIYGAYWRGLREARARLESCGQSCDFPRRSIRWQPGSWHMLLVRLIFGSDWLRLGGCFFSARPGLGRLSGRYLAWVGRRKAESSSSAGAIGK